jgi:hypothetical protein
MASRVHLALAPQVGPLVLSQAFTVAVRRRFAGNADPRSITGYVAQALVRQNERAGGRLAREAEAVIRSVLGETRLREDIPDSRVTTIQLTLIRDLVDSQQMAADQIDALIAEAVARASRYGVPTRGRRRGGLMRALGVGRGRVSSNTWNG